MRTPNRLRRALFLGLALCIIAGLPLTAWAAEDGAPAGGALQVQIAEALAPEAAAGRTTRAQYVIALYEAAGSPEVTVTATFTDVEPGAIYAAAVAWAEAEGIALRPGDGRFRPEDLVTWEDAAAFLRRALSALGETAQDLAGGVLAAYTGRNREADHALVPADLLAVLDRTLAWEEEAPVSPAAPLCAAAPPR